MNLAFTYETELCMRILAVVQERAATILPEVNLVGDISAERQGETCVELRDYADPYGKGRSLYVTPMSDHVLVELFWPNSKDSEDCTRCSLPKPPMEHTGDLLSEIWDHVALHFDPSVEG